VIVIITSCVCIMLNISCDKRVQCDYAHEARMSQTVCNDTMTVRNVTERYFDLADGDTVYIKGYLSNLRHIENDGTFLNPFGCDYYCAKLSDVYPYRRPDWGVSETRLKELYGIHYDSYETYNSIDEQMLWIALPDTMSREDSVRFEGLFAAFKGIVRFCQVDEYYDFRPFCDEYLFVSPIGPISPLQ